MTLGFYNGEAFGAAGLTRVNLVVAASGVGNVVDETFSTGAAALSYFTDNGLGDFLGMTHSSGAMTFTIDLSVTSDKAGAGLYGEFVIGGASESTTSRTPHS